MSNKVTLICQECNEPFEVYPSQVVKRKFCGQKCRTANIRGVSRTKRPKLILICPECDEPFEVFSASRAKQRKYCSVKCRGAARKRQNRVTLICQECNEPFGVTRYWVAKRKFCSRKCMSIFKRRGQVTLICVECDEPFEVLSSYAKRKFCSQDCNLKYRSRKTTLICERCNEPFEASLQRVNRKFCSKCNMRKRVMVTVTVTCQGCGKLFEASSKRVKRCLNCRTKRITLICDECNEPFEVFPSHTAKRKFCSRKCMSIFKQRGQVTLICDECDKPFKVFPYRAAKRKYCSACWGLRDIKPKDIKPRGVVYQQVISAASPRLKLVCKNCKIPFERTIHSSLLDFCSRSCHAQWVEKETVSRLTEEVLLQTFTQYTSILRVAVSLNATPDHIKIAVRLRGYKIVRKGTRSCIIPLEGVRID